MYTTFMAGRAPPCSRLSRINLSIGEGFRVDHDDYSDAELARDPFYQEFLLPRGAFWNAVAKLSAQPEQWGIELSFKRDHRAGPYDAEDRAIFDGMLLRLRSATRVAQIFFDAQASGMTQLLRRRADVVFEFDAFGRVRQTSDLVSDATSGPIGIVGRRIVTVDRMLQPAVDRALSAVLSSPYRPTAVLLPDRHGRRSLLQFLPVVGQARDIFLATAAVAVLLRPFSGQRSDLTGVVLCETFGFTQRETQVALLLTEGLSLAEIGRKLGIHVGTVRNHLKRIFEKSDVRRQAELVAVVTRLTG